MKEENEDILEMSIVNVSYPTIHQEFYKIWKLDCLKRNYADSLTIMHPTTKSPQFPIKTKEPVCFILKKENTSLPTFPEICEKISSIKYDTIRISPHSEQKIEGKFVFRLN